MATYDLKEISIKHSKKQPKMVDDLTLKTPVLERLRWEAASHGLWNMAEALTEVTGAQFGNANAPLPSLNVSTELKKTDLAILGGELEVAEDTADQFGGAAAYFAKKQPHILRQAGMDTEVKLYYDNWLAKAIADGNAISAGATSGGTYSIVVVRMEEGVNGGLFDPGSFKSDTLLEVEPINNAALYHLRSQPNVLGYGVRLKSRFGWQNLSKKAVAAIVNIQSGSLPTATQIDDAVADAHGSPADTLIVCHPKCRNLALAPHKDAALKMGVEDKDYDRQIDKWNGIPVVTSYNLLDATETVVTLP